MRNGHLDVLLQFIHHQIWPYHTCVIFGGEDQHRKPWDKAENVPHGNQPYRQQYVPVVAFPHTRVHYSGQSSSSFPSKFHSLDKYLLARPGSVLSTRNTTPNKTDKHSCPSGTSLVSKIYRVSDGDKGDGEK